MRKQLLTLLSAMTVSLAVSAQCGSSGTGMDGAYNATSNTTLAGGTYNFTTFNISPGVIVTVTGSQPLIINCTGAATIDGQLRANGGNGTNGVTFTSAGVGGIGVAGGGNGGDGTYSSSVGPMTGIAGSGPGATNNGGGGWSGGGGAGYSAAGSASGNPSGGFGGPAYGNAQISGTDAGSGGGGGSGGYSCGAGGGGAGGGYIRIHAASITIGAGGGIAANGGNGGSDGTGNCGGGGGGSGGSIWLAASTVTNNGMLLATGGTGGASNVPGSPYYGTGANGAPGRIRVDYGTIAGSGTANPAIGYSGPVNNLQTAAVVTTDVTCNGGSDGSAIATNMNGTPPYTMSWSPSGGNSTVATGLSAGTYTYTVTDAAGCSASATVNIVEPSAVTISGTVTNVDCNGACNGSLTVVPSGGIAPYTFAWAPGGQTTSTITNLCAGCYTITVTDANGCTATATYCVTEPPMLVVTASVIPPSCNGVCNATASGMATGGLGSYSYLWCNGDTTTSATNLCPGNCSLAVIDSVGCTGSYSFTITEPPPAQINILGPDTMICDSDVVQLCVPASFSTYLWTPTGNTTPCEMADTTLCYHIFVTDPNGCVYTDSTCVTESFCLGVPELITHEFSIIPNPANDMVSIAHGQSAPQLVEIYDVNGKLCRSAMLADRGFMNIHDLDAGVYFVRVNGASKKLVIER